MKHESPACRILGLTGLLNAAEVTKSDGLFVARLGGFIALGCFLFYRGKIIEFPVKSYNDGIG